MVSEMKQKYVKDTISENGSGVGLVPASNSILYGSGVGHQKDPFNTLAQLGKLCTENQTKMQVLAGRKAVSDALKIKMLSILDSPLNDSYRKSLFCCKEIEQFGQKKVSKYCNYRWCFVCNCIRAGILIKSYSPHIAAMKDGRFVTLTQTSVKRPDLAKCIDSSKKRLSACFKDIRAKIIRDTGISNPVKGIAKLEANYNPNTDSFNVHFHVIVDGDNNAEALINQWLKKCGDSGIKAIRGAQHIRVADEKAPVELFKYFIKLITHKNFNAFGMDAFFNATQNRRLITAYGGIKAIKEDVIIDNSFLIDWKEPRYDKYPWVGKVGGTLVPDWVSLATGELLSDYVPTPDDSYVFDNLRYPNKNRKSKKPKKEQTV